MEYEYASKILKQLQSRNLDIDKFIDNLRKLSIQKTRSELTCITYNVLRTNNMENLKEISKILISKDPDIIALQEVPKNFMIIYQVIDILLKNIYLQLLSHLIWNIQMVKCY